MDQLMEALRSERPTVPVDRTVPDLALLESIVGQRRWTARRRPLLVAAAAVVVAGAVLAGQVDVGRDGVRVSPPPPAAADVARIASASAAALASSGRALLDFDVAGRPVTGTVAFSGDDVEMRLVFGPDGRGPGFEAQNRTVDGQFYLWDAGRWVRDTNAAGTQGRDMFNADPRTLLSTLHPAAGFEVVGVEVVDGVELRHLRATRLGDLPTLNLSFGPLDPKDLARLELWVGPDDVVRRLDVGTLQVETRYRHAPTRLERSADGRTMVKVTEPPDPATGEQVEIRSTYTLRFVDIGAPITIVAPVGAVDVAGQG